PGRGRPGARRPGAAAGPRPRRRAGDARAADARRARVPAHLRALRRARRGARLMDAPAWQDFWANFSIFREAIITGSLAGVLLGFIGVHIVLRRMVFASSAIAQAAALGVAMSFWIGGVVDPARHAAGHLAGPAAHVLPSVIFEPVLWAIA